MTTCEMVPAIADKAREIVAHNGYGDRVTVLSMRSTDIVVGEHMMEPADVLVSEILSSDFVGEEVLAALAHARRHLITPEAQIIPRGGSILAFLAGARGLEEWLTVAAVSGFDLSPFNEFSPVKASLPSAALEFERLSDDIAFFPFDFAADLGRHASQTLSFAATGAGRCIGLVQWIRILLDDEVVFENHPDDRRGPSGWDIMLHRFREPLEVAPGDVVRVLVQHSAEELYVTCLGTSD